MKAKIALWYVAVLLALVFLAAGFLLKSWAFSLAALGLGLLLKKVNAAVPLPKLYREMGVGNEIFEGRKK